MDEGFHGRGVVMSIVSDRVVNPGMCSGGRVLVGDSGSWDAENGGVLERVWRWLR